MTDPTFSMEQVGKIIEALRLTTSALRRAHLPGAEYRVEQSENLLRELGIEPHSEAKPGLIAGFEDVEKE